MYDSSRDTLFSLTFVMENTAYHALHSPSERAPINKICELRHGHIKRFFWELLSLPALSGGREVGIKRLESHVPGACQMMLLLEMRLAEGKCKYS